MKPELHWICSCSWRSPVDGLIDRTAKLETLQILMENIWTTSLAYKRENKFEWKIALTGDICPVYHPYLVFRGVRQPLPFSEVLLNKTYEICDRDCCHHRTFKTIWVSSHSYLITLILSFNLIYYLCWNKLVYLILLIWNIQFTLINSNIW